MNFQPLLVNLTQFEQIQKFFSVFMVINKRYVLIVFFFLTGTIVFSQEQALKSIVQDELKRHLSFLASDDLQGRKIGEGDGLENAADYLVEKVRENGLQSIGNSYSQKVGILSVHSDKSHSFIKVQNPKGDKSYQSPLICFDNQTLSFDWKGEAVFAGFGMNEAPPGHNDFAGIDLRGKVVLICSGDVESFKEEENYQWNDRCERKKRQMAFEKGAAAVILITSPNDNKNRVFSQMEKRMGRNNYILQPETGTEKEKYFIATPAFADFMLGGKHKYRKYLESIVKEQKPNSFVPENDNIEIHLQKEVEKYPSHNILGMVEGSDPVLKNEYVIYMAHYDHLGINQDGKVFNGADDNASGSSVLLGLANVFSSLENKPKRSILFLWVTSEELGMFGSRYYVEHPVVPLEKTAACINLDMVGRVYEPRDSVWKLSPKMVKDFDGLFTLTNNVWPELQQISDSVCNNLGLEPDNSLPDNFLRSSDHYYFHKNGVPVLNISTGYHADYHKTSDVVSKINFDKLKRVADFCFLVGYEVANRNNLPTRAACEN